MAEKTAAGLVAYAQAQLGNPYWYGTFGYVANQALLDNRREKYPDHYSREEDYQRDIRQSKRVYDCVGLIKGYLWSETPTSKPSYNGAQDVNADEIKKYCKTNGSMATIPDQPGALVFMKGHVGVYIGDGQVIEARGSSPYYKVMQTKLSERAWLSWGKLDWITYSVVRTIDEPLPPPPPPKIGDLVRFQNGRTTYYPGGPALPALAKTGDPHVITQMTSGGKEVFKGASKCVLLGARVNLATGKESAGVNTWAAVDFLERVPEAQAAQAAAEKISA
ncbi:MAG: NlpC/P60 family protein [Firmicutes bacterium]|nr:NlpC/P60 family protein [Bacillota bacterium]